MMVVTIREHQNGHGDSYAKAIGDEYTVDVDEAARLIRLGYVVIPEEPEVDEAD